MNTLITWTVAVTSFSLAVYLIVRNEIRWAKEKKAVRDRVRP